MTNKPQRQLQKGQKDHGLSDLTRRLAMVSTVATVAQSGALQTRAAPHRSEVGAAHRRGVGSFGPAAAAAIAGGGRVMRREGLVWSLWCGSG